MGFPIVNQLAEYTSDHQPDENARNNCVPASIAAVLEDLTGGSFNGDELKDAVYGQGTTGPMDPARFVAYAAQQGVSMRQIWGTTQLLVAQLHNAVANGGDGLITIPSAAVADNLGDIQVPGGFSVSNPDQAALRTYSGPTHMCAAAYADADGGLSIMDPWGGKIVALSPAVLAAILVYGNVWICTKAAQSAPAPVGGSSVWTRQSDNTAKDAQGHTCGVGMADFIFSHNFQGSDADWVSETYYSDSGDSFLPLQNGVVLHYQSGQGVSIDPCGVALGLLNAKQSSDAAAQKAADALTAAQTQIAQLQQELAAAQQPQPQPTPRPSQSDAIVAQLRAALQEILNAPTPANAGQSGSADDEQPTDEEHAA